MTRIGIVGCGFIGAVHSLAIRMLVDAGLVDARVVATFDGDGERARAMAVQHAGCEAVGTLGALLDRVDVVWVCTWTAGHLEVVEEAASRGLPIFCEKPLAPSWQECGRVAAALRSVPHQVGLVLRRAPVFAALAKTVASGRYGRPLATVLRDDQYLPTQGIYESTWRADVDLAGGGTLMEHSIHDVDLLRWVLGEPSEVSARVANMAGIPGIDDTASVTLAYPTGATATLVSIWHNVLTRASTRRVEVFCEDAVLWADDDFLGPLHVETSSGREQIGGTLPAWTGRCVGPLEIVSPLAQYAAPSKAFLEGLAAGRTGFPDADTALAAHRLVELAYRSSADGGRPLRVDSLPT